MASPMLTRRASPRLAESGPGSSRRGLQDKASRAMCYPKTGGCGLLFSYVCAAQSRARLGGWMCMHLLGSIA